MWFLNVAYSLGFLFTRKLNSVAFYFWREYSFSLYDSTLSEISAPGASIVSTFYSNNSSTFRTLSGTSQSAPQVAGAAALVINILKKHNLSISPAQIEQLLKVSSKKYSGLSNKVEDGNELNLNYLAKAVEKAYPSIVGRTCN